MQSRGDRGVRPDSLTNQLRALAKHRPRKRPQLDPLLAPSSSHSASNNSSSTRANDVDDARMDTAILLAQTQSPLRLQWLVDDFVDAAGAGDLTKVDRYICGGIPVDRNHSVLHYSALHAAAALSTGDVAKALVQAGADVNALTQDRESALHMAARYGRRDVVHEILRHSADMKSLNHMGFTPLEVAADRQDHDLERLLEPTPDAPTDVHTQAVSSTSLTIAWRSNCSTASSTYKFRVTWSLGVDASAGESSGECALPYFFIANLLPASRYSVRVQAGNDTVGWSAPSVSCSFATDSDVPSAMVAPTIVDVSDSTIVLRLQLPQSNGAIVTRVAVQSQCTGAIAAVTTSSFRRLLQPQDHARAWESVVRDVSQLSDCDDDTADALQLEQTSTSLLPDTDDGQLDSSYKTFVATGLTPGCVYYFRAKAMNARGWSPDSDVSDGVCTNDCPKVVRTTARSMLLVWTKPYSIELIDRYELQARVSTATRWDVLATDVTGQSLDVCGLVPATAYSFRVVPHYALSGWGDAQRVTCSPLVSTSPAPPEPPVDFRVLGRTAHSITVAWRTPRCNGYAVESFALQQRAASDSTWTLIDGAIPVDCTHVVVERLERGCAYFFRVMAKNALGDSDVLEPDHAVWTYPFVAPTAPTCVARTSFSLHIAWHDGQSSDDPNRESALVFDVHMQQVDALTATVNDVDDEGDAAIQQRAIEMDKTNGNDDRDAIDRPARSRRRSWNVVACRLRDNATVVSGLRPLSCYVFRVCAHVDTVGASIGTITSTSSTNSSSSQQEMTSLQQPMNVLSSVSEVFQTLRRI